MSWCTIESDPGVFTQLVELFGVRGVQVEELYSLDEHSLKALGTTYGLIFLFKWKPNETDTSSGPDSCPKNVFFAKQVINNACATQALLSVLLNSSSVVDIGAELRQFKEFTKDFPPELKGFSISNSDVLREAHNSFQRPNPFIEGESRPATKDDDVYHFISYVPVDGVVYELDGLKNGPIPIGNYNQHAEEGDSMNWLNTAAVEVQKRIASHLDNEVRFSLLALTRSKRDDLINMLEELKGRYAISDNVAQQSLRAEILKLERELVREDERFMKYKVENIRRKHNYVPFVLNLLKLLAERNQLLPRIAESFNEMEPED